MPTKLKWITLGLALFVTAGEARPAWAARSNAKPAAGPVIRWLAKVATTRAARGEFSRWIGQDAQLRQVYVGYKSSSGYGTGTLGVAGATFGLGGMALVEQGITNPSVPGALASAMGTLFTVAGGTWLWADSVLRDRARGATVRFALANGFAVPRSLLAAMKRSGRFGEFNRAAIQDSKLHPRPRAGQKGPQS
jgi:hypothetical protein